MLFIEVFIFLVQPLMAFGVVQEYLKSLLFTLLQFKTDNASRLGRLTLIS